MATKAKSEAKREHLLERGTELIWENGYNGVSIRDIVQSAGVPKGSFYFYFDSKEDFVSQAIDRYAKMGQSNLEQIPGFSALSPMTRLKRLFDERVRAMQADNCQRGCMLVNISAEISGSHPELGKQIYDRWQSLTKVVRALIAEAQERGELEDTRSADEIADFVEMSWRGAVASARASGDPQKLALARDFIFTKVLEN